MPTVSILVPVYKAEKTLDACVESILAQSYADFELLLIDDASPDHCPEMCDAWAEKDPRIRALHPAKTGPGPSGARNAGLDAAKINRVNLARRKFLKPWQEYTMNDRVQWCVAAVPAPSWAAKVFPGIPVEEAMEKLWALIFDVCRVSTGDPVSAWKAHVAEGRRHRDQLNAWNLDHIHMTSSNGTDLTVGLADDATWEGASSKAENGTDFIANVPTEEVFCAPHRCLLYTSPSPRDTR